MDEGKSSSKPIAEIERAVKEFEEKIKAGTRDAEKFITIHEIEKLWGELRNNTDKIYGEMLCELMSNVEEGELIRKKKWNTRSGE